MNSRRIIAFLVVFLALVSNALAQPTAIPDTLHVPDNLKFNLRDVKGEEIYFPTLLGKGPLLVNFWAMWCEPCKQEMKALNELAEKFKAEGVTMVAVNTDHVRSLPKVRSYVSTHGINFTVLNDPEGSTAHEVFALESLPYSLILYPNGQVYKKHIGYTAGDEHTTEKELLDLFGALKQK